MKLKSGDVCRIRVFRYWAAYDEDGVFCGYERSHRHQGWVMNLREMSTPISDLAHQFRVVEERSLEEAAQRGSPRFTVAYLDFGDGRLYHGASFMSSSEPQVTVAHGNGWAIARALYSKNPSHIEDAAACLQEHGAFNPVHDLAHYTEWLHRTLRRH